MIPFPHTTGHAAPHPAVPIRHAILWSLSDRRDSGWRLSVLLDAGLSLSLLASPKCLTPPCGFAVVDGFRESGSRDWFDPSSG